MTAKNQKNLEGTEGSEIPGLKDFNVIEKLGEGKFAKVYLAERHEDGKKYAIKSIKKTVTNNSYKACFDKLITEKNILQNIDNEFIPKLFASFQTKNSAYLVMQYYPNGSLGKFAKSSFKNEIFYKPIFAQIINGLEALHKKRFAHLDIKPGNILIDSNFRIGLTDFGLSEIVEDVKELQIKGSPMFMAPEILKGRISLEADLWSLGVTMYMCITGSRPFDFKNAFVNKKLNLPAVYSAITSDIKYPPMSEQCEDLMRKLMKTSKEERLGAGKDGFEKLKRHPFFNGIDWNTFYCLDIFKLITDFNDKAYIFILMDYN